MRPNEYCIGITGGAGYIGSSLAQHLSSFYRVALLDVKPSKQKSGDTIDLRMCDVRNYDDVRRSIEGVDLLIHAAIIQIPQINENKKMGYEINVVGTQNVCKAVDESSATKGLILAGSWHTVGEKKLTGIIDEEFGFRPDKVEERARLYALSKIAQECIVRFYDELSEKVFGIIRMGTVIGEGMPEKTAANTFVENALTGKPLTPYKQSMFRPMLYVDVNDVCRAYENFAKKILDGNIRKEGNSLSHIFNVYYSDPITIVELAEMTKDSVTRLTNGKIKPKIDVVDTGQPSLFGEDDKNWVKTDISKATKFLELGKLKSPRESINDLIRGRLEKSRR
jgi:nucleoside-diphosphate-sugar epimerase